MIKKLSLIGVLMIMVLLLSSLYGQGGRLSIHLNSAQVQKFNSITNNYKVEKDAFGNTYSITSKIDLIKDMANGIIDNKLFIYPQTLYGTVDGIDNVLAFKLNIFQLNTFNTGALNINYIIFSDGSNYIKWELGTFGETGQYKNMGSSSYVIVHNLFLPIQYIEGLYNILSTLNGNPLLVRIGSSVGGFDSKIEGSAVQSIRDVLDIYMQIK